MSLGDAHAFDGRTDDDSAAVNRKSRSIREPNSGFFRRGRMTLLGRLETYMSKMTAL